SLLAPISFVYLHNIFGLKAKDNNGFRDPAMKTPFAVLNPGALHQNLFFQCSRSSLLTSRYPCLPSFYAPQISYYRLPPLS
ncbi:hypothetical protein MJL30_39225, partial [Salmonella enterica subsp. enterica serovar Anatum]|nr:hypothetical protein [Salmonella enterica subsp. enterica serovar Anatum]